MQGFDSSSLAFSSKAAFSLCSSGWVGSCACWERLILEPENCRFPAFAFFARLGQQGGTPAGQKMLSGQSIEKLEFFRAAPSSASATMLAWAWRISPGLRKVTAVGFEPTPLRTGAWSQRLRPLGQTVDAMSDPLPRITHFWHQFGLHAHEGAECCNRIFVDRVHYFVDSGQPSLEHGPCARMTFANQL